jgi:hypothetical protein
VTNIYIYIYIYIIPEPSSFTTLAPTSLSPLYSRANGYLVESLPRPLSSTPFLSFALFFYFLLLPYGSSSLLPYFLTYK